MKQGQTILDFINLESKSSNVYETTYLPTAGPNGRAFGGCTIAANIAAAASTVPSQFRIYSALGTFLGPALADRKLTCSVRSLRSTRSFATRLVEASQVLDNGETRNCMVVLVDFQVPDTKTVFEYSEKPMRSYSRVEDCVVNEKLADRLIAEGQITKDWREKLADLKIPLTRSSVETRMCPEGITAQTLMGATGKVLPTTQDSLSMPERTSAEWFRSLIPLSTPSQHCSFLAWILDGPTSWLPMLHAQIPVWEFSAIASLEFAIRFFVNDIDCNEWHMREMKTTAASKGRTFYEGKVWDQKGRMVASMTQQDIARPREDTGSKL